MHQMLTTSLVLLSVMSACWGNRPRYIHCQTSDECGKDSCCVIGTGRFTIPTCLKRLDVFEKCRLSGEPVNKTLHYPDRETVELRGVHVISCPCLPDLRCAEGGGGPRCEPLPVTNHLFDYSWEDFED